MPSACDACGSDAEVRGLVLKRDGFVRLILPPRVMGAWGTGGGLPVFLHPGEVKFVPDSALEEEEFKPSVLCGTMSEYRGCRRDAWL